MSNKNLVEHLAIVATVVGLIKIGVTFKNIHRKKEVRSYNVSSTSLGLATSGIWLWYDLSKGLKLGAATAGATICLDLYILHLLLQEHRRKDKRG
jgi:hypothetical protein